jgi:hypothetical protein
LRAFEQDPLAGTNQCIHFTGNIGNHGLQTFGELQRFVQRLLKVDDRRLEVIAQHEIVIIEHFAQLGGETFAEEQVLNPNRATRDFVFVRRADAAAGRADLGCAHRRFARLIERDVMRQDQRTGLGNS